VVNSSYCDVGLADEAQHSTKQRVRCNACTAANA
jgi:hypothetical protein